jgi:hypothetical protein
MAVKVRQRDDGSWWLLIDHAGRRKAKKIGNGKHAKQLAERAAIKITARLLDGDLPSSRPNPRPRRLRRRSARSTASGLRSIRRSTPLR